MRWLPLALLTTLVVFTPWVILGVLVLPARPGHPDLPTLVGAFLLSTPGIMTAALARKALRTRAARNV